jgi:O-methyltransferase involved in polyketide biosynthesis
MKSGILPERKITFLSTDITQENEILQLKNRLEPLIKDTPSFFLLEGITYYLQQIDMNRIFSMISKIQTKQSLLGFDFWKTINKSHLIYLKLKTYFTKSFNVDKDSYNFIDISDVSDKNGYRMKESTDIQELEKRYSHIRVLKDFNTILPEYYTILEKK